MGFIRLGKRTLAVVLASQLVLGSTLAGSVVIAADGPLAGTPYTVDGAYDVRVPHVVIHQVYGAGLAPDTGVLVSHGFIELFNPTEEDVDLSGWSLHYADRGSNAQTGPTLGWNKLDLTGTIKAKSSYLIRGKETGATAPKLDLANKSDQTWDRYINNKGMKVVLMSNQNEVTAVNPFAGKPEGYVDMIGTASNDSGSTIDGYETDYPTGGAEGTSKKKAIRRDEFADTDNNKSDFVQVDYEASTGSALAAISPRSSSDGDWANLPVMTTKSLPTAYKDHAYSAELAVKGGKAPYTFEATGLPAELVMSAGGIISGTPAALTSVVGAQVNVKVTDSSTPAKEVTMAYSLSVQTYREAIEDVFAITKLGEYSVGTHSSDGGVAEIVKFNKDNGKFYLVNGATTPPTLDIVALGNAKNTIAKEKSVLVKTLAETNGFTFGDLTSVDINTTTKRIYTSVQEADPLKKGKILVLDYNGNLVAEYEAGVQPDMIKSTPDGRYVMTADEAEPRLGWKDEPVEKWDAPGSVTIVDTTTGVSTQVYFDDVSVIDDNVHIRDTVNTVNKKITGAAGKTHAYYDLEPEYIALSGDNSKVYVALQENNAIATIDIANKKVLSVKGLGLKDFNEAANALDVVNDGKITLENVPFYGVHMPDGIASYTVGGQTYLFTANEGDATEWPNLENVSKLGAIKNGLDSQSAAYAFLNGTTRYDNLEVMTDRGNDGIYMYGGRSFSVWNADSMAQVYDSGSDFEVITSQRYPDFFNVSNSKAAMDDRSVKKGPEPEDIKIGVVGNRALAFIGLERVGGVMTYDVTNPEAPTFLNYTNSRVFLNGEGKVNLDTDTGPEGIEFIPATVSPTGLPLLLVAFEVGGKVGIFELGVTQVALNHKTLSLTAGSSSSKLNATVVPMAEGASTAVTWSSSDAAVASVDAGGNVTPLKSGQAVITAVSADGYGIAETVVTVSNPSSGGPWNPTPSPSATPSPTPSPTPGPTSTPATPEFSDVKEHWAAEPIGKLTDKKILEGMPDGSFKPDNKMTRAQYMAVLYRLLGLDNTTAAPSFSDVADNAWYSVYVRSLSAVGIAGGYPDGSFKPDKQMTREEAFVLLYRAMKDKLPAEGGGTPTFADGSDVSGWAQEAVAALAKAGILEGTPDGKLNPQSTITRAEIAKIVAAFVE